MKQANMAVIAMLIAVAAAAGGYWLGGQKAMSPAQEPKSGSHPARKILYYRNPMGLPDTSPVPKKDAMGMDYVPVYEGSEEAGNNVSANSGQVVISAKKVQQLGVKTEHATMRILDRAVRAVGKVEASERHIYNIAPKFEGWIETLHVNTSGEPVRKGQALFDVYSPDLVSAQREYAIAAQGVATLKDADSDTRKGMQQLADASLLRLKNWDISAQQVQDLASSGTARRSLTFYSPVNGVVLEKKAVQGMRFMPGEMLYQIADLSSVWIVADVSEQDIGLIRTGAKARVHLDAYPGREFEAAITYVYPTMNAATRTVPVRLELSNPQGLLKPAMFAQVELPAGSKTRVLAVPTSAVIDSGMRQIVLVQIAEGRFVPREVRLGSRGDNYVEVLSGVEEGEPVVVAANFLIDAESNLKAALGSFGKVGGQHGTAPAAAVGHQAQGTLDAVNDDDTVSITHEAIKSLGWPGMTMDFPLANSSLVQGIQPGTSITFELVERKPGEYVITKLQAKQPAPHEGH